MPTFRSNSSASTTMTVNVTEVARSNNYVTARINWSVTLGSETYNGASASNNRTLYIYHSNGTMLGSQLIKSSQAWDSGHTYSGAFNISIYTGTNNVGSFSVYIQTSASGTQSCIWTDRAYCTNFTFSWSKYWTDCGAATGLKFSENPFENSVVLSWTKGSDGINNPITGYTLYYRIDGGSETAKSLGDVASYILDTSDVNRGELLDFRLKSISVENTIYSNRSASARKNRLPNAPTSPGVPKTSYIPGETIRVSFSNIGDPDDNLAGFEVATDQSAAIVGSRSGASITYVNVDTTGWEQGIQRRFRVRGFDSYGVRGPWSTYTAQVTLNTAPLSPTISYPAAGTTVYSQRPRILLKAATTNDGPKHILCLNDGSEKTTDKNGSVFSSGTNDNLASSRQLVYRPSSNLSTGSKTLISRMYDSFLYSSSVSRSFTIGTFSPTDANLATVGMKIKAIHISQLQTAINNLRAAYGFAAYNFTAVVAGTTKISTANTLITQLQAALQAVIDRINGWDTANTTFDISVTWISPAAAGGGVDRVKLRQAIEQLRSTITLI